MNVRSTILLIGLFSFLTFCHAEQKLTYTDRSLPTLWKGLSGQVGALNIYVDTPAHTWDAKQKALWQKKTNIALGWLEDQAKIDTIDLTFKTRHFHVEISKFSIKKDYYPDNQSGWFEEVIQKLGYKDHKSLIEAYQKKLNASSVAVFVHVPAVFISHTTFLPLVSIISLKQPPFFKEDYLTRACTFAHELLHQYGAWHTVGPKLEIMAPGQGQKNINDNFIGVEIGEQLGWKVKNPIAWKAWDEFIHELAKHQKHDEALTEVQKALKMNPTFKKGHFWYDLGNIYYLKKEYSKALEAYNKALTLDPRNPEILKSKDSVEKLNSY
ncbi:MAG: tetratricopeptide repeat protein [Deltaproteobacteria bacterium]|nr:tetratricopeptide repeat protein [Deltaproteobacteria bacterium]